MTPPTHPPAQPPARATPVEVTLLTQADCAMCEHAKKVLGRVAQDHPLAVSEISLSSDRGRLLAARAGVVFAPGILLDGRLFGYGRLSERKLRKILQRA